MLHNKCLFTHGGLPLCSNWPVAPMRNNMLSSPCKTTIRVSDLPCRSWAWLPPTVRRLTFTGPLPADCPSLACVEEVSITECTTLNVTKLPSARVLMAQFQRLDEAELQTIPWLEQLVALPQLTRVLLSWSNISPGRILMQLPAGCELEVATLCTPLSESLPHSASLAHLVTLEVWAFNLIDLNCLAACPILRHVKLYAPPGDNLLDRVDLSFLTCVPERCSVALRFKDAAMFIGSFDPPAGWSVALGSTPIWWKDELILSKNGCTMDMHI